MKKRADKYLSWATALAVFAGPASSSARAQGGAVNAATAVGTPQGAGLGAPPRARTGGRPSIGAVRAAQPPIIDGRLDDSVWLKAPLIDTFVQEKPVEGAQATERTEVRIAYDSDRLYFGVYAHYSDLSLMRANRSDRDKTDEDDTVTIFLEPFLGYLRGYTFSVNGYGVQRDSMVVVNNAESSAGGDVTWNALYASAGQLVDDGWTAEMAIPIKSLRYPSRPAGQAYGWGFQIRRLILSKDEAAVWSPVSRSDANFLGQIGMLEGMTNLSTRRNFELLPTFTAINSGSLNAGTGAFGADHVEEGGVGLKYGINSNLTFDFTYNPDFSNIESETQQIEVNQRFPINYPELRPFFLEGQEIYQIPGMPTPVQTRRIVDPRYGAKLTGKVGGRTSIGLFLSDDEAPGNVDDPADPAFGKRATNVLGRVKYDVYRNSHVGFIFTDREFLSSYSRMGGFDTSLRLGQTHNFGFRVFVADQTDRNGVRKRGWSPTATIRKAGRNLDWMFISNTLSPDFANELSFVRRTNMISEMSSISYRWWPENWILNWGPGIRYNRLNDFDGVLQNTDTGPSLNFTFAKNMSLSANLNRLMERYRGIRFYKTRYVISGTFNTNRKILFSGSLSNGEEIRFITTPYLGRLLDYSAAVTLRPFSRLQSVVKVDGNRFTNPGTNAEEFDIKIFRVQTTYQFTDRLLVRNIMERNTFNGTLFANLLVTYRVNSGTVFYVGYDDRYKEGDVINATLYQERRFQRTNRAFFTKLQYLFRRT